MVLTFVLSLGAGSAHGQLLDLLPPYLGEQREIIDDFTGDMDRWSHSPNVTLRKTLQERPGAVSLQVDYLFTPQAREMTLEVELDSLVEAFHWQRQDLVVSPASWSAGVGAKATGGSVSSHLWGDREVASFNFQHSSSQSFDYIDYYVELAPQDFTDKLLGLSINRPATDDAYLELYLVDSGNRKASYTFSKGSGAWEEVTLANRDFHCWDPAFDFSQVRQLIFRSIGDISARPVEGAYLVDGVFLKWTDGDLMVNVVPRGERLRFYLKGDGSHNLLRVLCYDVLRQAWIEQARIPLDFSGWKHIEIPANNPFYFYYNTVSALRFSISQRGDDLLQAGRVIIGDLMFVNYEPVAVPLPEKTAPQPVFLSWGTPNLTQLEVGAKIGVNAHCVPMPFTAGNVYQTESAVLNLLPLLERSHGLGLLTGLHFYNNPSALFARRYRDWFPLNGEGVSYYDYYPGGSFLSLWHPEVQELWKQHIKETLAQLRANGALDLIDLVMISPGEEGQLGYQWDHIWAFDPYAQEAYREYLRTFYDHDIDRLNADWVTDYRDFDHIVPPQDYYPDREHWVFQEFYRYSMLKWCVQLASAVKEVYEPQYWLFLTHTAAGYPQRYFAGRYPHYYVENLRRLGVLDIANISALDWHGVEDITYIKSFGVCPVAEIDVRPTPERLQWTFEQALTYGFTGVYIGILENLSVGTELSAVGKMCETLILEYAPSF